MEALLLVIYEELTLIAGSTYIPSNCRAASLNILDVPRRTFVLSEAGAPCTEALLFPPLITPEETLALSL